MKTIIKLILTFFVNIWVFLFGKKGAEPAEAKRESVPEVRYGNRRIIPVHNNRRNTRGRFTQYILLKDGGTRPIYHGAK